jgi:O-methyltransferase
MKRHDLREILRDVQPYTMVHEAGLRFTMHKAIEAVEQDIPGHMVECGVWRGGCGLAMLLAQRRAFGSVVRPVHFMDSFKGLPPVTRRDGRGAAEWQASTVDNCVASRDELEIMLERFEFIPGEYEIWEGLFSETLPNLVASLGNDLVALLRLDGDWYDSTQQCLDALVPIASDGAAVIIDDYFAWDGCARATHDYLSKNDLPYRIRSLKNFSSAYFIKEKIEELKS